MRHRLEGVVSEVHKHEQAAVSPSFILNLTETTQEPGPFCLFRFLCLFVVCSLFLCVLRLERKGGVRRLHLGAVETFLLDLQLSLVCLGARSYVVTSFACAFTCARFVFPRSPVCIVLVSVRSGSRPCASTLQRRFRPIGSWPKCT